MASMRTLRRRLHRWERYAAKTYWSPRYQQPTWVQVPRSSALIPPGHDRAFHAVEDEVDRRLICAAAATYAGGWYEEPDDNYCCTVGDDGHDGVCVRLCGECGGGRLCQDCGSEDDLGCHECGGTGSCPECHGSGELVEELPWIPFRRIETLTPAGGIL